MAITQKTMYTYLKLLTKRTLARKLNIYSNVSVNNNKKNIYNEFTNSIVFSLNRCIYFYL